MNRLLLGITLVTFIAGCTDRAASASATLTDSARTAEAARTRQDSVNRAQPGYVVDSAFPVDEELRRFRKAIGGDSATKFVGGSASLDALTQRFVRAVAANDTTDLRAMVIHSREFADVYYPESIFSHPPYHQSPDIAWKLIQDPSLRGLTRLLTRLGGKPMPYAGVVCDPKVSREGRSTRYAGCLVRVLGQKGDTINRLYFGSIIERGGQFKFLSYTNSL